MLNRLNSLTPSLGPLNFAHDLHLLLVFSLQTLYNVSLSTSEDGTDCAGVLAYFPHFPQFAYIRTTHPRYPQIRNSLAEADESRGSLRTVEMFFLNNSEPVGMKRAIYICRVNFCARSDADKSITLNYSFKKIEIRVTFRSVTDYLDVIRTLASERKICTDGTF